MPIPTTIINGERNGCLSSLDRGLLYGDGVFETIAVKQGQLQYWSDHLRRLNHGCKTLGFFGLDSSILKAETKQLIDADKRCVIKIIITRGIGDRGYKSTQQSLTRIIQKFPWPAYPASYTELGIDATICDIRLSKQTKLAKIKHLNRLEQVLARSEWNSEYQEGLVCDNDGHIIEATSSNIFFEIDNKLITPTLENCGVAGILRNQIIQYCNNNNIELLQRNFNVKEIQNIQAMFVCNSIIGIWPVRKFNNLIMPKTDIIKKLMSTFNT